MVLGQGGLPHTAMVPGEVSTAVRLEHVWVEAWVDFFPSQGSVQSQGETWVPLDGSFKPYQYTAGMDIRNQVPCNAQAFVTQGVMSAQSNDTEGWVVGLDHIAMQVALTTHQAQVATYITGQKPDATVGDVLGTRTLIATTHPLLTASLPYTVVVRGQTWAQIPELLRHQFRFTLYTSNIARNTEEPVFRFTRSLPAIASKPIALSFVPASPADLDLLTSYLPQPPTDGSTLDPRVLPTALPGYLIHLMAELRVDGQMVAGGGPYAMGQELISVLGVYDPLSGWHETEATPTAGEYHAIALNVAGIAPAQVRAYQTTLDMIKTRVEAQDLMTLTASNMTGALLSSAILSYFALNDFTAQFSARIAGVLEYRRPSWGSIAVKVRTHFIFGVPRLVSFPGIEMDIHRIDSLVVSTTHDRILQRAYIQQSGIRQSALEHVIPEQFFTDAQYTGEAVSAVKALALASQQGQRLYVLTPTTFSAALPQLQLAPDILAEMAEALEAGKHVITSQSDITMGSWTGVGYMILDPVTGAGAYKISGGANGAFFTGVLVAALLIILTVTIVLAFTQPLLALVVARMGLGLFAIATPVLLFAFPNIQGAMPCFWADFGTSLGLAGALLAIAQVTGAAFVINIMRWIGGGLSAFGWLERLFIPNDPVTQCLWSSE